jgi:hypothetical protein
MMKQHTKHHCKAGQQCAATLVWHMKLAARSCLMASQGCPHIDREVPPWHACTPLSRWEGWVMHLWSQLTMLPLFFLWKTEKKMAASSLKVASTARASHTSSSSSHPVMRRCPAVAAHQAGYGDSHPADTVSGHAWKAATCSKKAAASHNCWMLRVQLIAVLAARAKHPALVLATRHRILQ